MNKTLNIQSFIVLIFVGLYPAYLISTYPNQDEIFPFDQDPYTCFILEKQLSKSLPFRPDKNHQDSISEKPSITPPPFSITNQDHSKFNLTSYDATLGNIAYVGHAIKIILAAYVIYTVFSSKKSTANHSYTREHNYLAPHAFDCSALPAKARSYERYCNIPLKDIIAKPSDEIMHAPEKLLTQQDLFHKNLYQAQQQNIHTMIVAQKNFTHKSYILHTLVAQSSHGSILSKLRARIDLMQFAYHADLQKSFQKGVKQIYSSWFDTNGNLAPINTSTQKTSAHQAFKDFIARYPVEEKDLHNLSQKHLERHGALHYSEQDCGSCKLSNRTQTTYNKAIRDLIRLADNQAPISEIYAFKQAHLEHLQTDDAQKLYDYIVEQKMTTAQKTSNNRYSLSSDPIYTSNNHETLLLRKEYIDTILKTFTTLQDCAIQDIVSAIPQKNCELATALHDPYHYQTVLNSALQILETKHPDCFLKNGILSVFKEDSYAMYMLNENIDPELAHIINYSLLMQYHDSSPEGVKELARKTVRLARLATNKDHVNFTQRNILAHTSYDLLQHAKNSNLQLHEMTDQARKAAHQSAIEKQEYIQHFYEQRKHAFEKTERENYKQFAQKYELHEDTVMLLCSENLSPLDFENFKGTNLQHELMHETIEGLDTLATLNNHVQTYGNCGTKLQNTVSTLTLFAQAAQEFNSECDLNTSIHCINTLHSGIEIIIEGVRGIGIGLDNLGSMIAHPIDTAKNLLNFTQSITWGLQEAARYCLFDRTFDTQRARKTESQVQDFLEGVANHIYYSCYESSPGDYARIATEQYTMLKAPGALLDAVSSAAHMAKNISLSSIAESEIDLFLKENIINEPYVKFASEITEGMQIKGLNLTEKFESQQLNSSIKKIPAIKSLSKEAECVNQLKILLAEEYNQFVELLNKEVPESWCINNMIIPEEIAQECNISRKIPIWRTHIVKASPTLGRDLESAISGRHWNPESFFTKNTCFEILSTKTHPNGVSEFEFIIKFKDVKSKVIKKTFFPQEWDLKEVFNCAAEALKNAKRLTPNGGSKSIDIILQGETKNNITIRFIIDLHKKNYLIKTFYPL